MNEHYADLGGNGGREPLHEISVDPAEVLKKSLEDAGLKGVSIRVDFDKEERTHGKKVRDLNSPKQARELLEENERREDELIMAAATLEHAAKRDLGLAARILNKGESSTDFLHRVHPSEASLLESSARCRAEDSIVPKAIAWGTVAAGAAWVLGVLVGSAQEKKDRTVKGRILKWLLG